MKSESAAEDGGSDQGEVELVVGNDSLRQCDFTGFDGIDTPFAEEHSVAELHEVGTKAQHSPSPPNEGLKVGFKVTELHLMGITTLELAASRLREFILSLSKDSIIAKKNGDLRRFFIKYPEYEELIRSNGGLKKFCSKKSHRKYVVWKDPADKTDQIGKIFVAMSSL